MSEQQQNPSIGAIWIKQASSGVTYFTGNIEVNGEKVDIVGFKTKPEAMKANPKLPNYRIHLSQPRESAAPVPAPKPAARPVQRPAPTRQPVRQAAPPPVETEYEDAPSL